MPIAKKAILAAHKAATETADSASAEAAARAVAHAAATVHVETHALGLVFYGLTALIYDANTRKTGNPESPDIIVKKQCDIFYDRLLYWQDNIDKQNLNWAPFLLRDDVPNKEKLLREKEMKKSILNSPLTP